MSIEFAKPLFLLLFPIVCILLYVLRGKQKKGTPFSRRFFSVLRVVICGVLILALAGIHVGKRSDITTTLFAVDSSDSVKGQKDSMQTFLQEAEKNRSQKDWAGVVCFGADSVLERSPMEMELPRSLSSYVQKNGTNISQALGLSNTILPAETKKRIVLLSDGVETTGDALAQARVLQSQGVVVDVFPLEQEEQPEVQISALELPSVVNRNTVYDITVQISSNQETTGVVRLLKGNTIIADEEIQIAKGESNIVFQDKTEQGGGVMYRGEIVAEGDTVSQNNKAYAYCLITDVPQILLLGETVQRESWQAFLQSAQLSVTALEPAQAPVTIEQLNRYDAVILADTAAEALPSGFLETLEQYIKTTGGGLLVSGGENAYALGAYYQTPLETILPVTMELETDGEKNNLGMVMVIDRSGSMDMGDYGISKIEMAKEACIRSLSGFFPGDFLGVVAFDDKPEWAVPFQTVQDNKNAIQIGIGNIQPGGGTSILPALGEALTALEGAETKQKHIILLTDGEAEQTGYDSLIRDMQAAGITLSTVAVGKDADKALLQRLAKNGGGRYYFTNEFTDLPTIFAKETLLAGKEYLNNRTLYPVQKHASAILSGIQQLPALEGYVGTTAKPRADVVLESDTQEPILATWQYGLGRTAAWTSDMAGQWTEGWLATEEGRKVLQNTLSWVMKLQSEKEVTATAAPEGDKTTVTLDIPYDSSIKSIQGTAVSQRNQTYDIKFSMTAPGEYVGTMDTVEEGGYILTVVWETAEGEQKTANTGFSVPYPKEYDRRNWGNGRVLLERLAQATGGHVLENGETVFTAEVEDVTATKALSGVCLAIALVLFLLDVFVRRFYGVTQKLEEVWRKIGEKIVKNQKNSVKKKKFLQAWQKAERKLPEKEEIKEKLEKKVETKETSQIKNTAGQLAAAKRKRKG